MVVPSVIPRPHQWFFPLAFLSWQSPVWARSALARGWVLIGVGSRGWTKSYRLVVQWQRQQQRCPCRSVSREDVVDFGPGGGGARLGGALQAYQRPGPPRQQAPLGEGQRHGARHQRVLRRRRCSGRRGSRKAVQAAAEPRAETGGGRSAPQTPTATRVSRLGPAGSRWEVSHQVLPVLQSVRAVRAGAGLHQVEGCPLQVP